jgi:hypothetical protein
LNDVAGLLKNLGQGKRVDELTLSLNRAAEAAVPMGKTLLVNVVKNMSVADAKNILAGGDTSVTAFFADKTRAPLGITFLPIVIQATEKVGLRNKYNEFAGKAAGFGLIKKQFLKNKLLRLWRNLPPRRAAHRPACGAPAAQEP